MKTNMIPLFLISLTINIARRIISVDASLPKSEALPENVIAAQEKELHTIGNGDPISGADLFPNMISASHSEDWIEFEVTQSEVGRDTILSVTISSSSSNRKSFYIRAFYEDTFETQKSFYFRKHAIAYPDKKEDIQQIFITVPDSLAYYDEQNLKNPTNYYASLIGVSATFSLPNTEEVEDIYGPADEKFISLRSPWFRKPRPTYCRNWELHLYSQLRWNHLPTCPLPYDSNLFASVVALPGNEVGFVRKLHHPVWPSHMPSYVKGIVESNSKFTISFWIFLTKRCLHGMCMVLQHRNSSTYYTPLILINREDGFHVQLHTKSGAGIAFTSPGNQPMNTWIFFMLTLDGRKCEMVLSYGGQAMHYVHLGNEEYHVDATDGLWVIGGYLGSVGFHGYLADVRLYRNINTLTLAPTLKLSFNMEEELNRLGLAEQIAKCSSLKQPISRYVLGIPTHRSKCLASKLWYPQKRQVCSIRKSRKKMLISNFLKTLRDVLRKKSTQGAIYSLEEYAKLLYDSAVKKLAMTSINNYVVAQLFETSGCLGYPKGYHASATMHKYGLGIGVNSTKTLQMHLMGAESNYALSQLALTYRHQLGIDGSAKHISFMAGYLRQAAVTTKYILEQENQKVVTESEMIRLDQVHLFRTVRGSQSELVKWLTHQAKMGSGEARNKIAEMLYYGRQGVDVDRNQAREFFEMAANDGDTSALFNLGVFYLKGINVPKNETKAFEFFKKAAEHNNSIAFNSMAFVEYVHHQNRSGAIYYWKKAADLDDGDGISNYATMLEVGLNEGDEPQKEEAFQMFLRAATKGQKNSCIKVGDYLIEGVYAVRDVLKATEFFRFVADQLNDVGVCLRDAINTYADGDWKMSLFHHLLATEAGIQLAGYNTALLLREYEGYVEDLIKVSDPYYFYNLTAEQGWSLSMVEMGHRNWYSGNSKKFMKKASQYYARSVAKDNNPEALYSLGYIVEHGYPIHRDVEIDQVKEVPLSQRNLKSALQFYRRCMETNAESNEGFYPCQLALFRIKLKLYLDENRYMMCFSVGAFSLLVVSIVTYVKIH